MRILLMMAKTISRKLLHHFLHYFLGIIKKQKSLTFNKLEIFVVIRMGLEPMTRSLEGCCSNPTELPNRPYEQSEKGTLLQEPLR